MKNQIQQSLPQLVGLPLWSIGRGGNFLVWVSFGHDRRKIFLKNEKKKVVSEYSLHVQCAWRLRHQNKIMIASSDRYYLSKDAQEDNNFDQRITNFLNNQDLSLKIITPIAVDESGNLDITLDQEYSLDIFPDSSINTEYWRIFKPYSVENHFVFTNDGLK